jgi:hypothetical protein
MVATIGLCPVANVRQRLWIFRGAAYLPRPTPIFSAAQKGGENCFGLTVWTGFYPPLSGS